MRWVKALNMAPTAVGFAYSLDSPMLPHEMLYASFSCPGARDRATRTTTMPRSHEDGEALSHLRHHWQPAGRNGAEGERIGRRRARLLVGFSVAPQDPIVEPGNHPR